MRFGKRSFACGVVAAVLCLLVATASAQATQITMQPALYPAFDPSITDYVVRCTGAPVLVTVAADPGTQVVVDGQAPQGGMFTASVPLSAGQEFQFAVATSSTTIYHVRCLPTDFPQWTFQRSDQPQAGWYAVAPIARTDFQPVAPNVSLYGAIFDTNGVPVWWLKAAKPSLDFKLLPNGHIGWAHSDNTADEIRLDGTVAHTVLPVGGGLDSHEFQLLPNGDYLFTSDRGLTGQTACGNSNVTIVDDGIEEVAPDGSLVWSWWASDHIPLSEIPAAWCPSIVNGATNGAYDTYHINAIEPNGDGYVVSFRHLDAIYRVKRADGSIDWKIGGVARPESLTVVGDPIFAAGDGFRGQHDARVNSDGTVSLHDNGFHPNATNRPPRAVRYAIDTSARTATLVQEVDDPGTVPTPLCCGSARMLPGGDWVTSWGSAGLVTELSSSGSRVMSLTLSDGSGTLFTYRAQPVLPGTVTSTDLRAGMNAQFPRAYARPKGATPLKASLVPAYMQCTSPNDQHGAPLAFGSCDSPQQASGHLTVGTPDANGLRPNAVGSVKYVVAPGDVEIVVSTTDVRNQSDLSDYTGQLRADQTVRITDRQNGSSQHEYGTVQDMQFPTTVSCGATADPTVGSTCAVTTSANAIVPGAVTDGKRAIWQIGSVQVYDGGSTGTAGASDATLFEDEGIFVP